MSLVEKALKKLQDSRAAPVEGDPLSTTQPLEILTGAAVAQLPATGARSRPETQSAGAVAPVPSNKRIVLNREALRAADLLPPEEHARRISHEYRQIKRPLIAAAFGKGGERVTDGQLIMLASALPGEGKTFTSLNLGLSMALEKDLSVLLIDADVAKPHISRTFGVEKEPGLLDALANESLDVESLVIPTDVRGLSILPAGPRIETATELLGSRRMQQVVTAIGKRDPNRIVLFDSPPLLLTSESRAIASVVGQIIIVVRAGFTLQRAVLEAVESLGAEMEKKSVGFILNQSEAAPPGAYYGYGEYYGDPEQKNP